MDMSLEEIIVQKNIQKPRRAGSDDGGSAKKHAKMTGWLKRSAAVKTEGLVKKHTRKHHGGVGKIGKFGGNAEPTKLIVSNLDYKRVTDSDIVALFGEFGPLKKAGVHYDKNGQSQGSAEVVYERHADAIKAMSQYNGVPLDGREMNIQIAVSEMPVVFNSARLGVKNGAKNKINQNGRTQCNGKIGNNGNWSKEVPSLEELDAELDEFVKNRVPY